MATDSFKFWDSYMRALDHGTPLASLERRFGRSSHELKRVYREETSALA